MKICLKIDDFISNERVAGITTGNTKEDVIHILGDPDNISNIYKKIGILIFLYGNLRITIYENFVSGVAVELTSFKINDLICMDKNFLKILQSQNGIQYYLTNNKIDFHATSETVSPKNSRIFFGLQNGRVHRFGLKDALVHGYVLEKKMRELNGGNRKLV